MVIMIRLKLLLSSLQETLSFLYSFLLFVSIIRLGHLLRPSSTMRRLGRALATAIRPLMGIAVSSYRLLSSKSGGSQTIHHTCVNSYNI